MALASMYNALTGMVLMGALGIAAYLIMHNTFSKPEQGNGFQKMVMSPGNGMVECLQYPWYPYRYL